MDGFSYVCSIQNYKSKKKIQRRLVYRCTKLFISSETDAGAGAKEMITNKKQTAGAIKAAVDQAKKVRPIEYTIKKGNSFKKRIDAYWKKQKEKQWLK